MAKKVKREEEEVTEEDGLKKLLALTKLMKNEKIKISRLGPAKTTNKWRTSEPKFAPKIEKPVNTVEAGGMDVDPSLKADYDAWRKDKEEEAAHHRLQSERKAKAAEELRRRMKEKGLMD